MPTVRHFSTFIYPYFLTQYFAHHSAGSTFVVPSPPLWQAVLFFCVQYLAHRYGGQYLNRLSLVVFIRAQYLAHRMAGSTFSLCSILAHPYGRQYFDRLSVFVFFLRAQYLAHCMAGSTCSFRTRDVSSRILTISVPSPPHGRQYLNLSYQEWKT